MTLKYSSFLHKFVVIFDTCNVLYLAYISQYTSQLTKVVHPNQFSDNRDLWQQHFASPDMFWNNPLSHYHICLCFCQLWSTMSSHSLHCCAITLINCQHHPPLHRVGCQNLQRVSPGTSSPARHSGSPVHKGSSGEAGSTSEKTVQRPPLCRLHLDPGH